MKKLIVKTFFVLLPVVIIVIAFELLARRIPTSYSTKLDYFNKKADKIEILVVGSSHSTYGINPYYFGREGFNISNLNQGLYQDYKVLSKYLPKCKLVKMVIIPISYFSLQTELSLTPEAWRCAYYSIYMGVEADPSASMFDLRNYSALLLWDGPLGIIKRLRNIDKINMNEYGYQPPPEQKLNIYQIINNKKGKDRVVSYESVMHDNLVNHNVSSLNRIVNELKKRNIKIIFVTTPAYKTFYSNVNKQKYDIMQNTVTDIAKNCGGKYFNYFKDDRFELKHFWDNDHLNEEGAKKFSIILKNEVIDNDLTPVRGGPIFRTVG